MPTEVSTSFMAFMSRSGTGVAVHDLRELLKPALRGDKAPVLRPLSRGDIVTLAGEHYDVLWPPPVLKIADHPRLTSATLAVRDLARKLAAAGAPELEENLKALESEVFLSALQLDGQRDDKKEELDRADRLFGGLDPAALDLLAERDEHISDEPDDLGAIDGGWGDVGYLNERRGRTLEAYSEPPPTIRVPEDLRGEVQRVYGRIRAANNDLSLILAGHRGSLVCYGDAGGAGLVQAARDLRGRGFDVSLAPHHGTHAVNAELPASKICIAQAGAKHHTNWWKHRLSHCKAWQCTSTAISGTVTVFT